MRKINSLYKKIEEVDDGLKYNPHLNISGSKQQAYKVAGEEDYDLYELQDYVELKECVKDFGFGIRLSRPAYQQMMIEVDSYSRKN